MTEISGDVRLSLGDRLRYLWRNGVRNISGFARGPATRRFTPAVECLTNITTQSPGRLLTEACFAVTMEHAQQKGRPIEVLEIGCGSGSMAGRLARLGFRGNYVGIDVDDRFRVERTEGFGTAKFIHTDAHLYEPARPIDLLVSVSALEHIPRDGDLIRRLSQHMAPGGLEFHAVPAGPALVAYLWHGYRQYTPASLGERFGSDGTQIIRLGGLGSFLLHVLVITPEIFVRRFVRARAPGLYRALLRGALTVDRVLPICPTGYVVVRSHRDR